MDQIIFPVIEHEDKTIRSRPKAVLVDLQLIEREGDIVLFAADASRSRIPPGGVPNAGVNVVAHIGITTGAINVEPVG